MKENRYKGWSRQRLENHRKLINEAIESSEAEELEKQRAAGGQDYSTFRDLHSVPGCELKEVRIGKIGEIPSTDEFGPYDLVAWGLRCLKHNVGSAGVE